MTTQVRLAAAFADDLDALGIGGLVGPAGVVRTLGGGSVTAPEAEGGPWTVTGDADGRAYADPREAMRAAIKPVAVT